MLLPVLALLCLEGALRLAGCGYPTSFFLVHKFKGRRVLTENDKFGWRFFGRALARTPRPMMFDAAKPAGLCRVFLFGGSAAYGDPNPDFGLPRVLEVLLEGRFPDTRFQVINAAMTAINSNVVLPIARDCAREHGDVWVIYLGNNEVVGPFGSGTVFTPRAPSLALIRATLALKTTRVGQLLARLRAHLGARRQAPSRFEGLAMFLKYRLRQTDPRMKTVYSHFARNLADILALAREHGVRVVLSTVVTNLKDCAPFGSEHRPGLGAGQLRQWRQLMSAGVTAEQAGEALRASTLFAKASQIDDQFAELQFRWGRCCLGSGRAAEARRHFILARDEDALRFRADTRINDLISAAASGRGRGWVRLADAERVFEDASPSGLPGNNLLYDHVHLNFKGNYLLARTIAEQVAQLLSGGVVRHAVAPSWMPMAECAHRLAWTDWARYHAARSMMLRINQPPFDSKPDYAEQYARLRRRLELFLPAIGPSGLRQAAGACRQALAIRPGDWVLWRNLGELQAGMGDFAGAEQSYRRVAEELPYEGLAWLELGFVLVQESRPEQALAQFGTGLRLKPDSVALLNGVALAQSRLGRTSRALRAYQRALELNPAAFDTRVNLGTLLQSLGRKQAAVAQFREVLSLDVETPENLAQLGEICLSQGWVPAAITNFTKAVLLNPADAEAQFGLGGAFELAGRHTEAQKHFAEAVRLDPRHARARVGVGAELLRRGQVLQAIEQLSQAVRLQPRLLPARLNLGIALLRLGRAAEARRQFEAALRLDPNSAFARQYLARLRNQDVKASGR